MAWSFNLKDEAAVKKEIEVAGRIRNKQCLVLRRVSQANHLISTYERVGFTEFVNIRAGVENEDPNSYVDETFVII